MLFQLSLLLVLSLVNLTMFRDEKFHSWLVNNMWLKENSLKLFITKNYFLMFNATMMWILVVALLNRAWTIWFENPLIYYISLIISFILLPVLLSLYFLFLNKILWYDKVDINRSYKLNLFVIWIISFITLFVII